MTSGQFIPVYAENQTKGRRAVSGRSVSHQCVGLYQYRRDVSVGVPLDLSTPNVMEWHELPKYNGIQVSQLI